MRERGKGQWDPEAASVTVVNSAVSLPHNHRTLLGVHCMQTSDPHLHSVSPSTGKRMPH